MKCYFHNILYYIVIPSIKLLMILIRALIQIRQLISYKVMKDNNTSQIKIHPPESFQT